MKRIIMLIVFFAGLPGPIALAQEAEDKSDEEFVFDLQFLFGNEAAAEAEAEIEVRVFRLQQVESEAIAKLLQDLLDPGMKITAYSRTNSLVMHGKPKHLEQAGKVIELLEKQEKSQTGGGEMLMEENRRLKREIRESSGPMISPAASALSIEELKQRFAASERRSQEIAAKVRKEANDPKALDKQDQKLQEQLKEAVAESFRHRQELHRSRIAELEKEIQKMKKLLAAREKIKEEIIDRRVADLKNPARRWDSEEKTLAPSPRDGPSLAEADAKFLKLSVREQLEIHRGTNACARCHADVDRWGRTLESFETAEPAIAGKITAVSEKNDLVEVSLGADDGLKPGMDLIVTRKDQQVGKVEVIEVKPDRAVGRIPQRDEKLAPIQVGDRVKTGPPPAQSPTLFIPSEGSARDEKPTKSAKNLSPRLEKLLKSWEEKAGQVKTLSGKLNRIFYNNLFKWEKRVTGRFYFQAPAEWVVDLQPKKIPPGEVSQKVDDEFGDPYVLKAGRPQRWITNGKEFWLLDDDKQRIPASPERDTSEFWLVGVGLMPRLFIFPSEIAEGRYRAVLVSENDKQAVIEFFPREKPDSANWQQAVVIFDKALELPKAVKWIDATGNLEIVYTFGDLKVNTPRPDWVEDTFGENPFRPGLPNDAGLGPSEIKNPTGNGTSDKAPSSRSVQLKLAGPETATILWTTNDRAPSTGVILPGRINVPASGKAIFQLENLPEHPKLMLFGSFTNHAETQVAKTYVRYNAVTVEFTDEDIKRAASGQLVTKAYSIPQDAGGIQVLASSITDPSVDILKEVEREKVDLVGVLRLGNRHSDIGENEDWHAKFLKGILKTIETERQEVEKELAVLEEALIEAEGQGEEHRATIEEKIAERKEQLSKLDRREELYRQRLQKHENSPDRAAAAEKARTK